MPTRVVHRVRCRKKDNKQVWADVKVVDAISLKGTDGKEKLLWIKSAVAVPYIKDDTGGPNAKGSPFACSRASHMELAQSADDPQQKMYVEVCDAVAIVNITPHTPVDGAGPNDEIEDKSGVKDDGLDGKGEITLVVPERRATKFIVDKTGLGLADGGPASSRAGHISLVTEKGNTDDGTDGITAAGDTIPPQKLSWAAVLKPDAVNVNATGSVEITMFIPKGAQDEQDWTVMTTDPETGDPCPPDNTDPNVYVDFPIDGDPNSPCIGANVKIPTIGDAQKPIDQGPLWWIERVSPSFRPWFWYADINVPLAFSFFGSPGRLGSWAWRGFVLWNFYPVIWILSANNALAPMGEFGSPSLDLCGRIGDWDFNFPPVPSGTFLAPGRPPGSTVQFPFSATSFEGDIQPGQESDGGAFGPFGCLQMTSPPLGSPPDAVAYGVVKPGSDIWDGKPNIWQLTGKQQPKRIDPKKIWDPFTNPYVPPSAKDAEAAARLFETNWNQVAIGHNGFIGNYVPGGGVSDGGGSYDQPPGWGWAIPWYDGSNGPPTDYRASFQNGIPPGVATKFFPLEIYAPATAWTLKVDQFDPALWDTNHIELYQSPINALLPLVDPPFLWSNDPWTGTNIPTHSNPLHGP